MIDARHRVHGVGVGDEIGYRIELADGSQAAASRQGDDCDARVNLVDGIYARTRAAVLPQAHQLDLLPDDGLPVLRLGRDADQHLAGYVAEQAVLP
jgi:hypothetical protein